MNPRIAAFIGSSHAAAMITLRPDGTPHAVRIAVALVDGKLWSSSTRGRARHSYVKRDPRSTLYIQDSQTPFYLTLECAVEILDGLDVPELSVRLFRAMQNRPAPAALSWYGREMDEDAFRELMRSESRVIYQFEPME